MKRIGLYYDCGMGTEADIFCFAYEIEKDEDVELAKECFSIGFGAWLTNDIGYDSQFDFESADEYLEWIEELGYIEPTEYLFDKFAIVRKEIDYYDYELDEIVDYWD